MKKYNIVLIGESHFVMKDGFQSGLESEFTNILIYLWVLLLLYKVSMKL